MEPDKEQYIQRYIRFHSLDVHPTKRAIIANYNVDSNMLSQMGDFMLKKSRYSRLEESQYCEKVIYVKGSFNTDEIKGLAKALLDCIPLAEPSKQAEVEKLLYRLHKRKGPSAKDENEKIEYDSTDPRFILIPGNSSLAVEKTASLARVDEYLQLLYEEMPEKIGASSLILQLAKDSGNLNVLRKTGLLGALARILHEDGLISTELSTNIVHIFGCFSVFTQFHQVITELKVGSCCIDVIDNELKKYDHWREKLDKKKSAIDLHQSNAVLLNNYEKTLQKYLSLFKKQDQLLRVCFVLLLHLAEDPKVEFKMAKKGIISLLAKCLSRETIDLVIVVVFMLLRLSIYIENQEEMQFNCIVEKVACLIPTENSTLSVAVLQLLFNLSFSIESRNAMVKCDLLQKLVSLISVQGHQNEILGILYHISFDDECKALFTNYIPLIMKMITEHHEIVLPKYLIALGINLAANKLNAQLMCENDGLQKLIERAFKYQDCLLLKMIRNISQHNGHTKKLFLDFMDLFGNTIYTIAGKNDDFIIECLGIIGNLTIQELDHDMLLLKHDLLGVMKEELSREDCEDDMILEIIILAGTFSVRALSAIYLLDSGIMNIVIDLVSVKYEDEEILLHTLYLFYQLLFHTLTREHTIINTSIPEYMLKLMDHPNKKIRKLCDESLEIISAFNEDWHEKIYRVKLQQRYNQLFEMIKSQRIAEADVCEVDSDILGIEHLHSISDLSDGSD